MTAIGLVLFAVLTLWCWVWARANPHTWDTSTWASVLVVAWLLSLLLFVAGVGRWLWANAP